ncbi:hypothetical protein ACIO3M_39550, partial [Streptomyces erythrochromogenes]
MLTYNEVMTTDLSLLTTAAGKWDEMAGELKKVEARYGDSVQKITMGPGLPHDRVTSELACPLGQVGRMSLCPSLIRKS